MENFRERLYNIDLWVRNTICPDIAEKKKKFQAILEDVFDPFIKEGKEKNSFDWKFVKYFIINATELNILWRMKIFCIFILKLFYTFDCEDEQLIMKIIYLYHQVLESYESLDLCDNCLKFNRPKHYHFEDRQDVVHLLKNADKVTAYKFTNRDLYSELTTDAMYEGDYHFLKFLMKYGLSRFDETELRDELELLFEKYQKYKSLQENFHDNSDKNVFINSALEQLSEGVENKNLKRASLIIKCVRFSLCISSKSKFYLEYVKCLNLYFMTLPEPKISVKDVNGFLNLQFDNDKTFINDVSTLFKEVFPESPSAPSPRSLKYLCRCTIRNCIRMVPLLPAALSDMQIPKELKDFLLFLSD